MSRLLCFLLLRCSFLWEAGSYRIIDSEGESITVASAEVRLRFTCAAGGVAIEVEPVGAGPVSGRYPLRTLCALLGRPECVDDAALLRASLTEIEAFCRGGASESRLRRPHACLT